MTIGEKIRYFRTQNQMTQEKLASELNISYQAVSKWERNESMPDILLAARLTEVLHISCDALLTENPCLAEREIDKTIETAMAMDSEDHEQYIKCLEMLEGALEKYPRSVRLMFALAECWSKGSGFPEYREGNYRQCSMDMLEYIAVHSSDIYMKYQAITMLCYLYRDTGAYDRIRELAESMPELHQTRPALLHHAMPGKQQQDGIYALCQELLDMTESYLHQLLCTEMAAEVSGQIELFRNIIENRELWDTKRYESVI